MGGAMIHVGVLTPHAALGPEAEFPAMAPGRLLTSVQRLPTAAAVSPLLDDAADALTAGSVDVIGYASTTTGYEIGFEDEEALVARISRRTRVPVAATCTSAVLALRVLDVARIALVHPPWFDGRINERGAAYFRQLGVNVVDVVSAELSTDPARIESDAVYEWTSRHVPPAAEAVFIGGNGFRTAGAIQRLEATLGRPVLTANQVLLWTLLSYMNTSLDIHGYGRLFDCTAPTTGSPGF